MQATGANRIVSKLYALSTGLPAYRSRLCSTARRWYRDEQGAVSTFVLLMLPLFFLAIFGLNAVWQLATVKQALRAGVYQSARFLSAEPQREGDRGAWRSAAGRLIERELLETPALRMNELPVQQRSDTTRARFSDLYVYIEPETPSLSNCPIGGVREFTVRATLRMDLNLLAGLPGNGGLPLGFTLEDSATGEVICPN